MAQTAAAVNTALGADGNMNVARIIMQFAGEGKDSGGVADTLQHWLVQGGQVYGGRIIKVDTTAANTAAQQATTIQTALLAGPA